MNVSKQGVATMMTLSDHLRDVKRWHTIDSIDSQTTSQHSFNMQMLVIPLFDEVFKGTILLKDYEIRYQLMRWCAYHDKPELISGDIPSPYKMLLKSCLEGFADFETRIEYLLCPELEAAEDSLSRHDGLLELCKFCDLIEATNYYKVNMRSDHVVNNRVLDSLSLGVQGLFDKVTRELPQYDWDAVHRTIALLERQESFIGKLNSTTVQAHINPKQVVGW